MAKKKVKAKKPQAPSVGEEAFKLHLRAIKQLDKWEREYKFHETRNWKFDFALVEHQVAVEIEGGTKFGISRHSKGDGFVGDCEKYNTATAHGWRVFRFATETVLNGEAIAFIEAFLRWEGIYDG